MSRLLRKDITQLLIESTKTDSFMLENVQIKESVGELEKEINYLTEADDEIKYSVDMIPVLMQESTYGPMYLVEYDMLNKLMESYDLDAKKALSDICEHNNIQIGDTYVVIESADYILEELKQFKREPDLKNRKEIFNAVKTVKDLKDKGIKLLTKKNNKKKKK